MSYLNGKLFTDVFVIDVENRGEEEGGREAHQPLRRVRRSEHQPIADRHAVPLLSRRPLSRLRHGRGQGREHHRASRDTSFVNTEDDHNFDKPATPAYGWSRDGKFVLLSDGWDIWQVAANGNGNGSTAINLTVNGKKDGIRYRGAESSSRPEPKPGIDLTQARCTRRSTASGRRRTASAASTRARPA